MEPMPCETCPDCITLSDDHESGHAHCTIHADWMNESVATPSTEDEYASTQG